MHRRVIAMEWPFIEDSHSPHPPSGMEVLWTRPYYDMIGRGNSFCDGDK